jgi:hypothetical protein
MERDSVAHWAYWRAVDWAGRLALPRAAHSEQWRVGQKARKREATKVGAKAIRSAARSAVCWGGPWAALKAALRVLHWAARWARKKADSWVVY